MVAWWWRLSLLRYTDDHTRRQDTVVRGRRPHTQFGLAVRGRFLVWLPVELFSASVDNKPSVSATRVFLLETTHQELDM